MSFGRLTLGNGFGKLSSQGGEILPILALVFSGVPLAFNSQILTF